RQSRILEQLHHVVVADQLGELQFKLQGRLPWIERGGDVVGVASICLGTVGRRGGTGVRGGRVLRQQYRQNLLVGCRNQQLALGACPEPQRGLRSGFRLTASRLHAD